MINQQLMQKIVDRLNTGPGLIVLHHNADIDAVGSAIALHHAFPNYSVGAFQNISQLGKKLISNFNDFEVLVKPELDFTENIVILDTSSPTQLGISIPEFEQFSNPIVIDHHKCNERWKDALYYCDESKSSCAEIILDLLEHINFKITSKIALALLVAIVADTGHFKYANPQSFINFAKLLEIGKLNTTDILDVLNKSETYDISHRIAHLKGAQRLRFQQSYGYLIASSQLSSFEASMCKHLIILGADVAFVGAQRDFEVRISGRATSELVDKGLHLGEFFQDLGSDLSCDGGGHPGAGGLNGIGDAENILNMCIKKVHDYLKNI
jgi:nanoRNase/pAp phosphatase (c-di-AMP/oligoRNAs hydrolase)